jgi:lipopolysaccharide transport system ATP-binding protein
LDLGAGFHPDLTGRENVFISGVISGLTRQEIRARFDAIVAFAELEAFIDRPTRTYSSGMQMRLAFAVAVHIEPEILLIDEVLSVGDLAFQRKCLNKIEEFKRRGCTIMLVSHDIASVQEICDEVLWLRSGEIVAHGDSQVITDAYVAEMTGVSALQALQSATSPTEPACNEHTLDTVALVPAPVELISIVLLNQEGCVVTELMAGDCLSVQITFRTIDCISFPIFQVKIINEDGLVYCDVTSQEIGNTSPLEPGEQQASLNFERLDLIGGQYQIEVSVVVQSTLKAQSSHKMCHPLKISSPKYASGILYPPHRWTAA